MESPKEYRLAHTTIGTLSVYDLLKHTNRADFIDKGDFESVYPLSLELNAGVFTRTDSLVGFPKVAITQSGDSVLSSCSCDDDTQKLCGHQAIIIHCILEQRDFRIFFDKDLRHKVLLQHARAYGLEQEPDLDLHFELNYSNGTLHIEKKIKELLRFDEQLFKNHLLPQQASLIKQLAIQDTDKRKLLVIGRHRYYNQLNFLLMDAEMSQSGNIKNPIRTIEPTQLIWKTDEPSEIKFYTAIATFQNKYDERTIETDIEVLKQITKNPLELDIYYHDRSIAETISAKSLLPVKLNLLKAQIRLTVFKKEPYFEITGEIVFNNTSLPFKNIVIRDEYFVYHQQEFHLVGDPDMLRVIKFFKENNEILLIHGSKYDTFLKEVLAPLEQRVHINYSYIHTATPVQLAEKEYRVAPIIYLHQEGNFISITPVMKYGQVEVPVYSRKQIFDTDSNGNTFRIERDHAAEIRLTSMVMEQHADFKEQIEGHEYFYLHKDRFLDEQWFLNAFEVWSAEGITMLGFNEIKNNKLNPHRAKITLEVNSGIDWFNVSLEVRYGKKKAGLKQLHRAIRNKTKFVQLDDGTLGILPDEWMARITQYFQVGEIDEDKLNIPKINFGEISDLFEKEVLSEEVQREIIAYEQHFLKASNIPSCPQSLALQAELRDYQQEGLNWLNFLDDFNFGGCLADDMGLGKTLQIIAFILSQREKRGHTTNLVVVPTSLLFNWQEEMLKFAPSIKTLVHYGGERKKDISKIYGYEVILTSYGMLLSDIHFLKKLHFNYVFLDESQAIKNPDSERYKAARLLQSRNRIVLTGTPVENNTFDLYGQLSFACPGLLGSRQYFRDIYAIPIDRFGDSQRARELQLKIQPFILRRTKQQVAAELPEKTEMVIYCEMNAVQRKVYDAYERELREFISATNEEEIQKNSMHVLTGLTKLRQICNDPVLLKEGHPEGNAVKIEVLTEQIESKSKAHKILVFSQFVGMLDLIKVALEQKNIPFEYLTGQTKDRGAKVQNFQTNEAVRVFLISLKAGGVGLNLTEADYVYLVDPWWNPAVENQAIDRSHRIGQTKNIIAVRLICINTIEEKIMKMQEKKNKLAQDIIKAEDSMLHHLSKDNLLEILDTQ